MKETLYTIPLTDAFHANDECPFCFIERNVEQDLLDFTLGSGSSYMESDIREATDQAGFCRTHFQKMFNYGNTLGNAWILKTHYELMNKELKKQIKMFSRGKTSLMQKIKKEESPNSLSDWALQRDTSCYICKRFDDTYKRYMDTFFFMYKKDDALTNMLKDSKGFCLHHFGDIMKYSETALNDKQKDTFYPLIFDLMEKSLERVGEDIAWLVEKFDYKNKDADWKNSKDAVQRGMQKLRGGYPADPVYKQNK